MKNFFADDDFVSLMKEHAYDNLYLLKRKGLTFSILVNLSEVSFDPPLPEHIKSNFKPITMFVIAGYTFETFEIYDDIVEFEAGFGSENIGSVVNVPLSGIIQILVEDTPIFINLSRKVDKQKQQNKIKKSTNIFLSNPENRKFLKKRKKNPFKT